MSSIKGSCGHALRKHWLRKSDRDGLEGLERRRVPRCVTEKTSSRHQFLHLIRSQHIFALRHLIGLYATLPMDGYGDLNERNERTPIESFEWVRFTAGSTGSRASIPVPPARTISYFLPNSSRHFSEASHTSPRIFTSLGRKERILTKKTIGWEA